MNKDEYGSHLALWESSPVRIINIQHGGFNPTENKSFKTIASSFLFVIAKNGKVILEDIPYTFERFHLFHIKRKTNVTISTTTNWIEYYIVYYQNGFPIMSREDFVKFSEQGNPFETQYAFLPSNPILIGELVKHMYELWIKKNSIKLLSIKADFYKLISEVYSDIVKKTEILSTSDKYEQLKNYIDKHYGEKISIKSLIQTLDISSAHINRLFIQKTGLSPQQYLIETRLNNAKKYLANSNISLNEVSVACGYSDLAYFCRFFKMSCGLTPTEYREISPMQVGDLLIDSARDLLYNNEVVSYIKLILEGDTLMFKKLKKYGTLATTLCLVFVMCACQAPESEKETQTVPVTKTKLSSSELNKNLENEEKRCVNISNFNRMTTYTKVPERVISLSYSETEILVALGLSDKIVGIATADSSICDCLPKYQEEIKKLNVIAGGSRAKGVPTLEVMLSCNPDFVYGTSYSFSSNTGVGNPEDFDANNINFYAGRATYVNGGTMEDVYEDILNIGRIFDVEERAANLVEKMKSTIKKVNDKTSNIENPVNVFIYDSGTEKAYTPGMSLETDMVRLAGGRNVFGDIPSQFSSVSWESVVEANPDIIVIHKWDDSDDPNVKINFLKSLPELSNVSAVKNDRFVVLKFNLAFPCVQNANGIAYFAENFYPELFK